MASIAVYVHFPFCLSICPYCDFDRQATGFNRVDVYLEAVERELSGYGGEEVHSVFFGGGTPSLMTPGQLASVLHAVRARFDLLPNAEVTVECNPGDADLAKLAAFRDAGATRLSFGVQSLDDTFLKLLGRRHSSQEARQAARWAREAGFQSFNLDFMFGLPGQSLQHWQHTLEQAIELGPQHLSCYLLTLDEKVPMGRDVAAGRLVLPDDDTLADMYQATRIMLAAAGYEQYEVSNWARPGHESRHNLTYWRDGEWIGVGAGAASTYRGQRWKNAPHLERYISSFARIDQEEPDLATRLLDHVTLGLRLREGISVAAFADRFGIDVLELLGEEGASLLALAMLECSAGRLRVAADQQLILNEILVRLNEPISSYARLETSTSQSAAR